MKIFAAFSHEINSRSYNEKIICIGSTLAKVCQLLLHDHDTMEEVFREESHLTIRCININKFGSTPVFSTKAIDTKKIFEIISKYSTEKTHKDFVKDFETLLVMVETDLPEALSDKSHNVDKLGYKKLIKRYKKESF